jgi:uncharacterized membrane protein YdbT with pleckstrin-like domain
MQTSYPDPSESDIAWRGYSGWVMWPSFLVCGLMTLLLLVGGWFIEGIRGIGQETGSWVFFILTILIWVLQFCRWFYRGATVTYRLTDKKIHIDRGFLSPPVESIKLIDIQQILVGQNLLGKWFGVGWVSIQSTNNRREVLEGVYRPEEFADLIRTQVSAISKSQQTEPIVGK